MLAIVIRITITIRDCLKPSVSLKHTPWLIHCPIRENKRRRNLCKFSALFWRSILSRGCWVDLHEGCWLPNTLAQENGAKLSGFRKYWNVQCEAREYKNGQFPGLGSSLNIILTSSWSHTSGVHEWSKSAGRPHPGTIRRCWPISCTALMERLQSQVTQGVSNLSVHTSKEAPNFSG